MLSATSRLLSISVLLGFGLTLSVAQEIETIKTDTNLVAIPVIATTTNGIYVTDLRKEEFTIAEDGVRQEIAFFGKVAAPFHVVLMLDTSSSTKDKLTEIQQAAYAFVQQLQPADRVKVISFDDQVRDLNEFTNDRETLRKAINTTRAGDGTKVYDAIELALNTVRRIQGRKAIVIFTDGMDWHSDTATFSGTVRWLDEEGVIVYPIRYDTRATSERLAREQAGQMTPQLPTIDVIRRPTSGTTPPTFPGGDPIPTGTQRRTGPLGLPPAEDILRGRRQDGRYPTPTGDPTEPVPDNLPPDRRLPDRRLPDRRPIPGTSEPPVGTRPTTTRPDDSITAMLNAAYAIADSYLQTLAEKSGGRLLRADTLQSLPDAFSQIAAELRTQYMLGYYPINKARDERYRSIKVTTSRKDVVIRARPGYLATGAK
jgi:Mg-chelatase subunit ChlD